MAAEPIHIETEDEIPVIIERIRSSPADEVHLVLPPRARFGQSRFNFQLLRQYATRLGKRVAIASADPTIQRFAEESGFGAIRLGPAAQAPPPQPPPGAPAPWRAGTAAVTRMPGRPAPPAASMPAGRGPAGNAGPTVVAGGAAAAPPAATRLAGISRIVAGVGRPGSAAPPGPRIRIAAPQRLPTALRRYDLLGRNVLYAGGGLVAVVLLFVGFLTLPSARVTLIAQAQPFSQQVEIAASPGNPAIHVRAVTVTKSASLTGTPSGNQLLNGVAATGQFTYVNACTFPLIIPSGQRLTATNGVSFAQLGDAPLAQGATTTVNIKATQPGQNGNVGAGAITSIANNQFQCLAGGNQAPTTGGSDGQKQTVIQNSDVQSLRAQLETTVRQQIMDELNRGLQKGEKLPPQPLYGVENFTTNHNVGESFPNFTATLSISAEGDYYVTADVDRAFANRLLSKVPPNMQLTSNQVTASPSVTASPGGNLDFTGTVSGFIAPRIDTNKISRELAGKPVTSAHDVLTGLPIKAVTVSQSPIPLPVMPFNASRITIDYQPG